MNALKEIGVKKAINFVFYSFVSFLLKIALFPQARSVIIRVLGGKVGKDSIIHPCTFTNLYHFGFSRLTLGKRCFIGEETMLDMRGYIVLEDDVTVSNRCNLITHINVGYKNHPLQKAYPTKEGKILIKKGAYLGTAVTVLPGVEIGENAVVGAGSVVTKNILEKSLSAGVPARLIRKIER